MTRRSPLAALVLSVVLLPLPVSLSAQQATPAAPGTAKAQPQKAGTMTPDQATDPTDPLFGVGPLPEGRVSLVGGTVDKVDRVRNRVAVKPFGNGQKMSLAFDERTHIYRDGVETTERGIRRGDRVYIDTMLDGTRLFARNIRVVTSLKPSDARGQVMAYDPQTGTMTVLDDISSVPVTFRVTGQTSIKSAVAARAGLVPGSLVTVRFSPDQRNRQVAQEVSILAAPGSTFTFVGKVTFLDLRSNLIAVHNQSDDKTYELEFAPGAINSDITVGSDVVVKAEFVGRGYRAETVSTLSASTGPAK